MGHLDLLPLGQVQLVADVIQLVHLCVEHQEEFGPLPVNLDALHLHHDWSVGQEHLQHFIHWKVRLLLPQN